jgi:mannose-6-phosphate isomerase-like protein (cupin superfamily)
MAKSVFISSSVTQEALRQAPKPGKHPLLSFRDAVSILGMPPGLIEILENQEVTRFGNPSEVHDLEADLWIGLEGEVTFVVGGELVEKTPHPTKQKEWKGTAIHGGEEYVVSPRDILYIPPGEPHTHYGSGRLYIVKIPTKRES